MKRTLLVFFCAFAAFPAGPVKVEIETVPPEVIQQRLSMVSRKMSDRTAAIESLFRAVGCEGGRLSEQPVPHSKSPNVLCSLPGETDATIIVSGHIDFIDVGAGAVDDWSGAVLLPSLYQSLSNKLRRHRFVFAGFTGEEDGLLGSSEYVKKLAGEERTAVHAMINLECLGLSSPQVWASRADKRLLSAYYEVESALQLQRSATNVDNLGDDDSHPFLNANIPVLTIHSVNHDTFPILHSSRDTLKAIRPNDYYTAYHLAATYLAYLDTVLD
jgi:hypothetical protein